MSSQPPTAMKIGYHVFRNRESFIASRLSIIGKRPCATCRGFGNVSRLIATQTVTCPDCNDEKGFLMYVHGTGNTWRDCVKCGKTGKVEESVRELVTCDVCGGSGEEK